MISHHAGSNSPPANSCPSSDTIQLDINQSINQSVQRQWQGRGGILVGFSCYEGEGWATEFEGIQSKILLSIACLATEHHLLLRRCYLGQTQDNRCTRNEDAASLGQRTAGPSMCMGMPRHQQASKHRLDVDSDHIIESPRAQRHSYYGTTGACPQTDVFF